MISLLDQDTCDSSSFIYFPPCSGLDLLIHEATFDHTMQAHALEAGHSTARMAAEVANKMNARLLVLTHVSPRYEPLQVAAFSTASSAADSTFSTSSSSSSFIESEKSDKKKKSKKQKDAPVEEKTIGASASVGILLQEAQQALDASRRVIAAFDFLASMCSQTSQKCRFCLNEGAAQQSSPQ